MQHLDGYLRLEDFGNDEAGRRSFVLEEKPTSLPTNTPDQHRRY